MIDIAALVREFAESVGNGEVEIYNEFSLQQELGIFLRRRLPDKKVQFERNLRYFRKAKPGRKPSVKKEIDISIFSPDKSELACAIELKFPRNGQYPEQMFAFCKDIQFAEELRRHGFRRAFAVFFAEHAPFYSGKGGGIYGYFRRGRTLAGCIRKPTGKKDQQVRLEGKYRIEWTDLHVEIEGTGVLKYTLVEAASGRGGSRNSPGATRSSPRQRA